ncbi:hypothetical protein [Acinetobacter equi]|uniref:Uncharacterized protein n=1 Tax=Acinetobacter equi TaxID=1324350 RepID=A0A0N9VWS7_9GAMM|nr:hypothetical protein [Acinetobacter equi]ALH94522.1 hypothetical protein AOY20_02625 [Acinetobacter equi]
MARIFYLASGQLNLFNEQRTQIIPCESVEKHKKNLLQIQQKKQWKTTGTGAHFMGLNEEHQDVDFMAIYPTGMIVIDENHLIYTASLEDGSSICLKNIHDLQEAEGLILRKSDFIIRDLDYDAETRRLVLSASESLDYEQHLCVLALDGNSMQFITEGQCFDANPYFNPLNSQQIFYDTCGIAYDNGLDFSPKEICRLDLSTGDLDTILSDEQYDFMKPQVDQQGNLYCIQRPYSSGYHKESPFLVLKNVVLAPVKIIKAVIGWLDFFTQKYTGESLKTTSGANPAKTKQKSEEELFIEGNLIKAKQSLENNQKNGEKYPGFIPRSWQLIKIKPTGEKEVIKQGVMSFCIGNNIVIYSNGKHLIQLDENKNETLLCEDKLISKIML